MRVGLCSSSPVLPLQRRVHAVRRPCHAASVGGVHPAGGDPTDAEAGRSGTGGSGDVVVSDLGSRAGRGRWFGSCLEVLF